MIRSNVRQILKSVTYSRNLDMDLGLGLLNTLKPYDAINWLEDALNKYKIILTNGFFSIKLNFTSFFVFYIVLE